MGMSPPASIPTNPAEVPRQNSDASTPPSITGLAISALEQGPASAASLADRAVEPANQQTKELAKRISENHLSLKNYSLAELDAIAPYLTCVDCTDLSLSDEQLQDFIRRLTNVELLIIRRAPITNLTIPRNVKQLDCSFCSHLGSIQFAENSQLQKLDCWNIGVTSLNVPATVTELQCKHCSNLTRIQFAENSQLQKLVCWQSGITSLNVPATVTKLYCYYYSNLTRIQFAENSQLQTLICCSTGVTSLNVPATVTELACSNCYTLTSIQFAENSQLQKLTCSSCPALSNIQCEALPHCSELQYVHCPNLRQLPQLPLTAQVTSESSPSQSFNRMPVDAEVLDQNALAVLLDLGYNHLLQGRFFPSIVFVESETGTPAGIDLGGLRRHVVATIFKNLIDNEEMFARYDDEVIMRLPKLMPNAGEDMRTAMRTIGHLFALCYSSDTMRTGVYFEPALFETILWLMYEKNLRLSNLDERIFAQLKGWNYDTLDDATKQAIHDHILECDIVSPVKLIAAQMKSVLPPGWQVNVTPEYLQRKIQGLAVDASTLSGAIRWEQRSASQEELGRTQGFLNTWIARMQQENRQKLDDLVFFATGNRSIGDARITVSLMPGVDPTRLPIAHTCSLQIEIPIYESQEIFDQKIELALSSMTGFHFG